MRTTLQDVATRHRFHPRKLLRAVAAELDRAHPSTDGPFEVALDGIGVSALKREGASKTTYSVTDEDALVGWFRSVDTIRITLVNAENTAVVLDGLRKWMVQRAGRPQPGSHEAQLEWFAHNLARLMRGEPSELG
ncbi:hypothetical protein [Rubrivirga sp. IMCC43871]|uniref:hypothetical protein n=1 Tax=Rubrivirga sp. IMCC43871 TaxID=3391575 RepID=UPI00398F931D